MLPSPSLPSFCARYASLALTAVLALSTTLSLQGCGPSQPEGASTPYASEDTSKNGPHNPLIDGAFPVLRQDTFYTTDVEENGKTKTLNDRFVANGKGFVAYCEETGFDNGYYLYNFYGHSSYYVLLKDREFKVAMTSPGDDLIVAYQHLHMPPNLPEVKSGQVKTLPEKEIDGAKCSGVAYTFEGAKHEDWFDVATNRLVEQTVEKGGRKIKRHLKRFNKEVDTMLLRLPQGLTLIK